MVPWLCAIPLAVGGGYVSDVLINKGANPAAINVSVIFLFKDIHCFFFPCRIQRNICEEVNAGKLAESSHQCGILLFFLFFFSNMNLQVCIDAQGTRALEF